MILKGKEYAYQYRKTIFWIFIAFITMRFTDILSLGASWQNMCQNNPNLKINKKQKGGAEGDNAPKAVAKELKLLKVLIVLLKVAILL